MIQKSDSKTSFKLERPAVSSALHRGGMDKDVKDVGSGDDTSECYIITISERRRRVVWFAVLVVCVCVRAVVCCSVAILRRILEALWRTSAARVGLWWIRTTTCNKDSDDSLCRHLRLE